MRPILFTAFGWQVASAAVFAGLAALTSYLYFERRKKDLGFSEDDFWKLIACLAIGVVGGAVGFYALVYGGGLLQNAAILWRTGGFPGGSFLGAYLGAATAAYAFCRFRGLPFGRAGDVLGAAAPLGLSVMRIGCLLHGCCYGLPTSLPWAITFTKKCAVPYAMRGVPLHPTQIYELLGCLAIFLFIDRRKWREGDGLAASVCLYAALRFGVDFLRAGDRGLVAGYGFSAAQWLALAAMGFCAWRLRRA